MKPLLVGESNPYGTDPGDALLPYPDGCAGWRLCVPILQMSRAHYLRTFDRANLLEGLMWSIPRARDAALELVLRGQPLILLGAKVSAAFEVPFWPFHTNERLGYSTMLGRRVVPALVLPHPSGRCRIWNEPGSVARARLAVESFLDWVWREEHDAT